MHTLLCGRMYVYCAVLVVLCHPLAGQTARTVSTLLGGSGSDYADAIACDGDSNVYVVGNANSWDFPAPEGQDQPTIVGGYDVVVAKLSPALDTVLAVAMLGGWGDDEAVSVDIASDGRVIVTGFASAGFPSTPEAFQPEHGGGLDVFVAAFDPDLNLLYSTFLGGTADEQVFHARLDARDVIAVVGYTKSAADYPTKNAYQTAWGGGQSDSIVAQIRPDPSVPVEEQLVYSTLIGGSGNEFQEDARWSHDVSPAPDGRIAAFVHTTSTNLRIVNPYQPSLRGDFDAYLCVIDPSRQGAAQLTFATYLGGASNDAPKCVRWFDDHTLALVGWTYSGDFPKTEGVPHHGNNDVFVSILDIGLGALLYGTLIGGSSWDTPIDLVISPEGDLVVVGRTISSNFPAVNPMSPFNTTLDHGFIFALKPGRSPTEAGRLWFSSSFGGSGSSYNDYASQIVRQPSGRWIAAGYTGAADFPTTPGVVGPQYSGGAADFFITQMDFRLPTAAMSMAPKTGAAPLQVSLDATASTTPDGIALTAYRWDFGDGEAGTGATVTHTYDEADLGRRTVTLTVENDIGLTASTTDLVSVTLPTVDAPPWRGADIGAPRFPGGSRPFADGATDDFVLCAGGNSIESSSPQFRFLAQELHGSFALDVYVERLSAAAPLGATLGLMCRESLEASGQTRQFALAFRRVSAVTAELNSYWRDPAIQRFKHLIKTDIAGWLRIERRGDSFMSLTSEDGLTWTPLMDAPVEIPGLPDVLFAGVCALASDTGTVAGEFQPLLARASHLSAEPLEASYGRGDTNSDAAVNIADAVFLLSHLFASGSAPSCKDAADANDDGALDIADPIRLLSNIFPGPGTMPPPPDECGLDPSADSLSCDSFSPCD